jgi:hypothetical protein
MGKRVTLSDDFLRDVQALLNTPPPPKKRKAKGKRKAKKSASKRSKKARNA